MRPDIQNTYNFIEATSYTANFQEWLSPKRNRKRTTANPLYCAIHPIGKKNMDKIGTKTHYNFSPLNWTGGFIGWVHAGDSSPVHVSETSFPQLHHFFPSTSTKGQSRINTIHSLQCHSGHFWAQWKDVRSSERNSSAVLGVSCREVCMGPAQNNTPDCQQKWWDNKKKWKLPFSTIFPISAVNMREQSFLHSSDHEQFIVARGAWQCITCSCHILLQPEGTNNSED